MKTSKIFDFIFIVCCFMSCQTKENDNVVLTDFSKDLISMYVNDIDNFEAKNRKDEIIIISLTDTLHYYLDVFANDYKAYKYCREDFIGQTAYLGHSIKVFGENDSPFYFVTKKVEDEKKCKAEFTVPYDPLVWTVALYKDTSFCKMRTYRVNIYESISDIQSLAEKYFKIPKTIKNENYQWFEVEKIPRLIVDEDSLKQAIYSDLNIKNSNLEYKKSVYVNVFIDRNGKAKLQGIRRNSNNVEIDNDALRVAKIICQYEFLPAIHRGEPVDVVLSIKIF